MDTKLRNISRKTATKSIAFVMVVILFTAAIVSAAYVDYININLESLFVNQYKDSETFANEFFDAIYDTYYFTNDFPRNIPDELDYLYYLKTDGLENTNSGIYTKEYFLSFEDAAFIYENGNIVLGENTAPSTITRFYREGNLIMYIAFPDEYMAEKQNVWELERDKLIPIVATIIANLIISLALIIYLIRVTGRKHEDENIHYSWIDKVYSELLLFAFIPALGLWFGAMSELSYYPSYNNYQLNSIQVRNLLIIGLVTAIVTIICGILLLSIVRKIKGKILLKHSITYKFFSTINDFIKSLFDGRKFSKNSLTKTLHQRQVIFIVASFLLVLFTFIFLTFPPLMIMPPILEIALIYWYIKYNNETFGEINKGFDESIEEQMKSERMKIDLITNVSHDLKTPLTSIISYVDLLSKEEDLSESARDYVNILMEKSNRLKNIVSDLFDLAKSTSGNINMNFEMIDLKKLIEQTLGDMEDSIEESSLQIKTNLPEEPVNILSDGKKLYRVFQNIIDNALKYSLQGTRIFIELEIVEGKAIVTIKNIASYEMNFTPDEIMERFTRGDKSRTTEGSGLGLSIAESFTQVSGGKFSIDVDGDMFKVIISFQSV